MAESTEAVDTTVTTSPAGETPTEAGETPETFDGWLGKQDEATRALIDKHTSGLKSSLDTERADRKSLAAQLRALQSEGDPVALRAQLSEVQATLAEQEARATFAEEAHAQGVANIKLAYLAAKDAGVLGKREQWARLSEIAPELFAKKGAPPAAAGHGSGASPTGAPTMNDFIRGRTGAQ